MCKIFLSIILSVFSVCCIAQTSQNVQYFKNESLTKETDKEKALFSKTITISGDTTTTEVKDIKNNEVIGFQSYKAAEPIGIWIIRSGSGNIELDYNFTVTYLEDSCSNDFLMNELEDYFIDIDSIGYVAPRSINGQPSVQSFIIHRVIYPIDAMRKKLQGVSTIYFTIDTKGKIKNITALKGSNILLDKEAIRVIKLLTFSSPAKINGQPKSICVRQRIKFSLTY